MQGNNIRDDIDRILASIDGEKNDQESKIEKTTPKGETEHTIDTQTFDDIQDIYVLVVREREIEPEDMQEDDAVETTLANAKKEPDPLAYTICLFGLFLILSCIIFQLYFVLYPPTATITIIPKSQQVTLTGTLQIGRLLNPITLSQSQTAPTTGKGHQDARQATGTVTFYNGLFTSQAVAAGTILTGSDGVQVITDQDANIPAANPPNLGQATVTAHVVQTGPQGNIPAYGINTPCCLTAVKVVNTQAFTGGQDAKEYRVVTQADINSVAATLKIALAQSMQAHLGQEEVLYLLPCIPAVRPGHQPGQEASQVQVTMSATCTGIAYNRDDLLDRATQLLSAQAAKQLGTRYSALGTVQVRFIQATIQQANIILDVMCQGTWVYQLSQAELQQLKHLLAGKTLQQVMPVLLHVPGIERLTIDGLGENQRFPKDSTLNLDSHRSPVRGSLAFLRSKKVCHVTV